MVSRIVFLSNGAKPLDVPSEKQKRRYLYSPHPICYTDLRWIIDLNMKSKVLKVLKKNIRK